MLPELNWDYSHLVAITTGMIAPRVIEKSGFRYDRNFAFQTRLGTVEPGNVCSTTQKGEATLWVNGAYGIGKTSVCNELQNRLPVSATCLIRRLLAMYLKCATASVEG